MLSELRKQIDPLSSWPLVYDEGRLRLGIENKIEDTEVRLELGYSTEQFDEFWDNDCFFECRYPRSKWVRLGINS